MKFKHLNRHILSLIIIFLLSGTIFLVYSASQSRETYSPYDSVIGEIPDLGVNFFVEELSWGGELRGSENKESALQGGERFQFSHLIIKKMPVYGLTEVLMEQILIKEKFYFNLIIRVYERCQGYTGCTITSKVTLTNAFIAGYNIIFNQYQDSRDYDSVEVYEFGYESVEIESPNTIADLPQTSFSPSPSSTTTTSTSGGVGHLFVGDAYLRPTNFIWELTLDGYTFNFTGLQFSLVADTNIQTFDDRPPRVVVNNYRVSDIFFEKDAWDASTVYIMERIESQKTFAAFIDVGFCDAQGRCETPLAITLTETYVTSLLTYLSDSLKSEDAIFKTEVFSLSSNTFALSITP